MMCPPEVVDIMLEILQAGLLRIRARGWADDSPGSAVEADHLHNLPTLLLHYSPELLRYYWDVERPAYLSRVEPGAALVFDSLWTRLKPFISPEPVPALTS